MGIYQYPPVFRPTGIKVDKLIIDGSAEISGAIDFNGNTAFGDTTGDTAAFFGAAAFSVPAAINDVSMKATGCTSAKDAVNSILDVLIGFGLLQATA